MDSLKNWVTTLVNYSPFTYIFVGVTVYVGATIFIRKQREREVIEGMKEESRNRIRIEENLVLVRHLENELTTLQNGVLIALTEQEIRAARLRIKEFRVIHSNISEERKAVHFDELLKESKNIADTINSI